VGGHRTVGVGINKTGRDDVSRYINDPNGLERGFGYLGNLPVGDPQVTDCIQPGFRVDDPAVIERDVREGDGTRGASGIDSNSKPQQ